jgi:dUTP pyrophosphatase
MFHFAYRSKNTEDTAKKPGENAISEAIFQAGIKIASFTTQTFITQPFAVLKLYVHDDELKEKYIQKAAEHNEKMLFNDYPDSGFDLFVPDTANFTEQFNCKMIDFKIKAEMQYSKSGSKEVNDWTSCGYYLYPRSSISKTPLMLANHTGIIDAGYRGFVKGAFRHLSSVSEDKPYCVEKHTRLLQVCHPSLCPVLVTIVDNEADLSDTTRGEGGFGSTGK